MSAVIERLMTAVNAHDLDAAAALFHRDYDSRQPAHPARAFIGSAQFRANWQAIFAGIPDFRAEMVRSVEQEHTTWCEWAWFGRRTDGQPFEARGVALFRVENDLIVAGTLYMEDVERDGLGVEARVEEISGRRPDAV